MGADLMAIIWRRLTLLCGMLVLSALANSAGRRGSNAMFMTSGFSLVQSNRAGNDEVESMLDDIEDMGDAADLAVESDAGTSSGMFKKTFGGGLPDDFECDGDLKQLIMPVNIPHEWVPAHESAAPALMEGLQTSDTVPAILHKTPTSQQGLEQAVEAFRQLQQKKMEQMTKVSSETRQRELQQTQQQLLGEGGEKKATRKSAKKAKKPATKAKKALEKAKMKSWKKVTKKAKKANKKVAKKAAKKSAKKAARKAAKKAKKAAKKAARKAKKSATKAKDFPTTTLFENSQMKVQKFCDASGKKCFEFCKQGCPGYQIKGYKDSFVEARYMMSTGFFKKKRNMKEVTYGVGRKRLASVLCNSGLGSAASVLCWKSTLPYTHQAKEFSSKEPTVASNAKCVLKWGFYRRYIKTTAIKKESRMQFHVDILSVTLCNLASGECAGRKHLVNCIKTGTSIKNNIVKECSPAEQLLHSGV